MENVKNNTESLTNVVTGPGFLTVHDCEPLTPDPPVTCENPIDLDCRLTILNDEPRLIKCVFSVNSGSSNDVSLEYDGGSNTIFAVINDVGVNNGGPFDKEFQYTAGNREWVDVDAKKGGQHVGKVRHKINYGTE